MSDRSSRNRSEPTPAESAGSGGLQRLSAEEALRAVIQASPLPIVAMDADGLVTLWNASAEATFGWTEQEVLGRYLPYVPEDRLEEHRRLRERVLGGDRFENAEVQRLRKDGRRIELSVSTAPMYDEAGKVAGIMSVNVDITDRKRVEEELRQRERVFRGLFENMTLGVVYQAADGHILSANPAAERILGLSVDQIKGRTSSDPDWRAIHEDGSEFPGDRHPSMRALETGRPVTGVVMGIFHPPSKETRWLLIDAIPEFLPGSERPYQVFTTFLDITEQRRANEALDKSTRLLMEAQKLARLGHYDFDARTGFWESSEVLDEIFGIDETYVKDVEGWLRVVHPEERDEMSRYLRETVLAGDQGFDREYRIIRISDQKERWVHGRGAVVLDDSGRALRMLGTIQDVSDRKSLEERLAQAQKLEAVGQLAGGIAHDFNNMLSVILGYAELIKSRLHIDEDMKKDVLEIEKAAAHSRDITSQLLAFSRRQIISPRTIDLNASIRNLKRTLLPLIGEDIELNLELAQNVSRIRFDPSQIEQILVNLAVNGRDAMPDGGTLTIETANVELDEGMSQSPEYVPGRYVLLQVSDDGIGMGREVLSHVFEPFFTTKEQGKGTGLGLATVYGIVKQNGGFVSVYSEPGQGAVFRIYIPRMPEDSRTVGEAAATASEPAGGTILLVEDDDMVREMVSAMLGRLGYSVIDADSPSAALEVCRDFEQHLDLLMTDVVMPELSGHELAGQVRALQPGLGVLFMSGYTANAIVHRGVLEEGVEFIQKPFNLAELDRKVHTAIAKD